MKLIVGLGNPGKEYDGTRHNIGREIVRALVEGWTLDWKTEKKLHAETARYKNFTAVKKVHQEEIVLALPTTYMNESSRAVQSIISHFKFQITDLLVVHDDLDLPLGTLRFSQGSGAAGQKGVQSIINALGTKDFARLRIGVAGEHRATTDAAAYILKKFTATERALVAQTKKRAEEAVCDFIKQPLTKVMNMYNKRGVSASRPNFRQLAEPPLRFGASRRRRGGLFLQTPFTPRGGSGGKNKKSERSKRSLTTLRMACRTR